MGRGVALAAALLAAAALAASVLLCGCSKNRPDWRILQLYSGETSADLLLHPAKVQMFRLAAPGTPTGAVHAGPYAAAGDPVELTAAQAAEMSAILADPATYDWQRVKQVPFVPKVGVWFVRGAYILEVALDLDSAQIGVYAGGQALGSQGIDAARARIAAVAGAALK